MPTDRIDSDIAVVGGGPAGLAAAVALQSVGRSVALVAPPRPDDRRTTALLGRSVDFLRRIGAWPGMAESAAPLRGIRIVDATRRLIRAPELRFDADELGLEAFGYNVANDRMAAGLERGAVRARRDNRPSLGIRFGSGSAEIRLSEDETLAVRLVVAADGRGSPAREAAGIAVRRRDYPQTALVATLSHEWPHEDFSTEFHTEWGPFTFVPLPGRQSSLVWVLDPTEGRRLSGLPLAALAEAIEARSGSLLGRVAVDGAPQLYPLSAMTADSFSAGRIALVGEAAHVVPPIGAQGFNMALRDIETLAELIADGADPGAGDLLATYDRKRRRDAVWRGAAIDAVNRSLLTDFLPVQALRGFGLFLLDRVPPLRRFVMRQALAEL